MTLATSPALPVFDSTADFLRDGYRFGQRRFDRLATNAFRTRLALRPVTLLRGAEAARAFYAAGATARAGALPPSVMHLLQDEGSVQSLEGEAHDHRKLVFLAMARDAQVDRLTEVFRRQWRAAAVGWQGRDSVVLHDELLGVLTRTALEWAGVPDDGTADARAGELGAMIEHAGSFGPPNWIARARRLRAERWARDLVGRARRGELAVAPDTPFGMLLAATGETGEPLPPGVVAVELLNVLRPLVAVGRFVVFAALALHRHPARRLLFAAGGGDDLLLPFAQEVRRYYPFFPVIGGTVTTPFEVEGHRAVAGAWVMLDLFATNRHAALWTDPERFDPDRFVGWAGDPNTLVPQGGGDAATGHRCPGEPMTLAIMVEAIRLLTRELDYTLPAQRLRISLRRFPALPQDGVVIAGVRVHEHEPEPATQE